MHADDETEQRILILRRILTELVCLGYTLSNPLVVAVSQALDEWIIASQKRCQ
ncbi:hypothetical protein TPY_2137 [Sulfobacillus acidophilus TPY]|uniref:Aspartyl-phosphate phosphatase Spo0E family protein n=1 Tax=Sulfobacillus acidophilus (strain ATCC 700253 / DSM 10332 / NAL) TaxID=679936 RepID=G8TZC3_SULAD|nr:hypothetical protein TPY_2137 [Sulfobacillus acidophilus TPY]AEW04092.1 hypothetical protein Sulac_0555 [Sulfobacillus acidophilus DSM 10332]